MNLIETGMPDAPQRPIDGRKQFKGIAAKATTREERPPSLWQRIETLPGR
jgi:hypothetical protein